MKLTIETTKVFGKEITKYLLDGVLIAIARRYADYFCTIDRNGSPSNIRTKMKKCREFIWNADGLRQILGHRDFTIGSIHSVRYSTNMNLPTFMESYPDTTWGDTGRIPGKKEILNQIIPLIKKKNSTEQPQP